jgi:hypothetical protein
MPGAMHQHCMPGNMPICMGWQSLFGAIDLLSEHVVCTIINMTKVPVTKRLTTQCQYCLIHACDILCHRGVCLVPASERQVTAI